MSERRARRAWVLNLDADLELASTSRVYAPTRGIREALRRVVPTVAAQLLRDDDLLVDESTAPGAARGYGGRAFCPTPRAIAALVRAGAEPEPAPPFDVLRHVNSRVFCSALGATLEGAELVTNETRAKEIFARPPPVGDDWRAKRAFGMSGRGQRIVPVGAPSDADLGFVRACIAEGGVQIEPNVAIDCEWAIHGMLDARGALALGALVRQRCDEVGAWIATERADDPAIASALTREATRVAQALHDAGYFGPFGIDAFTYEGADGAMRLQPRSEINARYTMGFAVGFGRV